MKALIKSSKIGGELSSISSKSAAHRILIASAFSDKETQIYCRTINEDIVATVNCLKALGVAIDYHENIFTITPPRTYQKSATLPCNESGTTLRLLLPVVSAIGGDWIFDMSGRLPSRPLSPLKEELMSHGISFENISENKLKVSGKLTSGSYKISGEAEFEIMNKKLTAWMLIALGIGVLSPIINFIKHKKVFFIHSIPCKISGGLLTVIPFAIHFGFIEPYLIFMLALITFSMIEIVIMSSLLKTPDPDAASIYEIMKQNKNESEYIII